MNLIIVKKINDYQYWDLMQLAQLANAHYTRSFLLTKRLLNG
ncbi:hypothetical protein [Vreelandella olivaria]|nr:hypothetical protein [Halomonas olivaria]